MQQSHKIARERVNERKIKSQKYYEKKEQSEDLNRKKLILFKDKMQKNTFSAL